MSYGEIYIIGNFVNDKLYVGQTKKGIKVRWDSHIHHAIREGKEYTPKCLIDRAIRKHGKENFCMYVVDIAKDQDELNEKEKLWIAKLKTQETGYNISPGGGFRKEYHQSEETRRKNSERMKGEKHFNYGKHLREDTRKKISKSVWKFQQQPGYVHPCTGKPRTPEVCRLVREHWNKHYVTCPHCGCTMESRSAKRYHFDRCPENPNHIPNNIIDDVKPLPYCRRKKGKIIDLKAVLKLTDIYKG